MADGDSKTSIGWRLFWAVVAAGLTFTVLSVSGLELGLPAMIGITVAVAVGAAIVGPMLLDLLALVF